MEHSFNRTFLNQTFLIPIFLKKGNSFFLKASMKWFCVAQLNSKIKGHHVYGHKYTVNEEFTCTIDHDNKHSSNAIKFLFLDDEKKRNKCNVTRKQLVGHLPESLAKILYPMMKEWCILSIKAIITVQCRRAPESTWVPRVTCNYPVYIYLWAKTHKKYIHEKIENEKTLTETFNILTET